jgi:hypothetical protein
VALMVGLLIVGVRRLPVPDWLPLATRLTSFAAVATGSVWIAQRAILG